MIDAVNENNMISTQLFTNALATLASTTSASSSSSSAIMNGNDLNENFTNNFNGNHNGITTGGSCGSASSSSSSSGSSCDVVDGKSNKKNGKDHSNYVDENSKQPPPTSTFSMAITSVSTSNEIPSPSLNTTTANKRMRTRITAIQLKCLRRYFNLNNSPNDDEMIEIQKETGLPQKVIKHWFRNTLFKERQKSTDSPYNFSVPPMYHIDLEKYDATGDVCLKTIDENDDSIYNSSNNTDKTNSTTIEISNSLMNVPQTSNSNTSELMFDNNQSSSSSSSSSLLAIDHLSQGQSSLLSSSSMITGPIFTSSTSSPLSTSGSDGTTSTKTAIELLANIFKMKNESNTIQQQQQQQQQTERSDGNNNNKQTACLNFLNLLQMSNNNSQVKSDEGHNVFNTFNDDSSNASSNHITTTTSGTTINEMMNEEQQCQWTNENEMNGMSIRDKLLKIIEIKNCPSSSSTSASTSPSASSTSSSPSSNLLSISSSTIPSTINYNLNNLMNVVAGNQLIMNGNSSSSSSSASSSSSSQLSSNNQNVPNSYNVSSSAITSAFLGGTSTPTKRSGRTKFLSSQIKILQDYFDRNAYPKDHQLEELSRKLNLQTRVITVWFQNQRQKLRKTQGPQSLFDMTTTHNDRILLPLQSSCNVQNLTTTITTSSSLLSSSVDRGNLIESSIIERIYQNEKLSNLFKEMSTSTFSTLCSPLSNTITTTTTTTTNNIVNGNNQENSTNESIGDPSKNLQSIFNKFNPTNLIASVNGEKTSNLSNSDNSSENDSSTNDMECTSTNVKNEPKFYEDNQTIDNQNENETEKKSMTIQTVLSSLANLLQQQQQQKSNEALSTESINTNELKDSTNEEIDNNHNPIVKTENLDEDLISKFLNIKQQQQQQQQQSEYSFLSPQSLNLNGQSQNHHHHHHHPQQQQQQQQQYHAHNNLHSNSYKRQRTNITAEQHAYLLQQYSIDPSPDRRALEEISQAVSLSKRVVQVWFQNTRARERKGIIKMPAQLTPEATKILLEQRAAQAFAKQQQQQQSHQSQHRNDMDYLMNDEDSEMFDESDLSSIERPLENGSRSNVTNLLNENSEKMLNNLKRSLPSSLMSFNEKKVRTNESNDQEVDHSINGQNQNDMSNSFDEYFKKFKLSLQTKMFMNNNDVNHLFDMKRPDDNSSPVSHHSSSYSLSHSSENDRSEDDDEFRRKTALFSNLINNTTTSTNNNNNNNNNSLSSNFMSDTINQEVKSFNSNSTVNNSNGQLPRRVRTQMNQKQIHLMRCIFSEYRTPTMNECERLGELIDLPKRVIQVWFQNSRAKQKRLQWKFSKLETELNLQLTSCKICNVPYNNNNNPIVNPETNGNDSTIPIARRNHLFSSEHIDRLTDLLQIPSSLNFSTNNPLGNH
ncbi:hypothetical protein SNEBB_000650 [Seison nebaliae]|nr:hypothetical protein SNEBB_000650 [Seison nebaliae]